ncbi:MAG: aminotransferase class I/II-fold pyridoxal phosphate-dependent enzyme, partial [Clostridia bacterium]|nr:aminotransferase class I/II-fold pyridoxal phosphate-dependent enzyme [Clostridia bacterium]
MSKFLNASLSALQPYIPGEQPCGREYIKLNTNESPYFPSKYAVEKIDFSELENLRLYSDPECLKLSEAIAHFYNVSENNVLPTNGSDEALAFCFLAFCERGAVFPDITYGFYKVFANLFGVGYKEVPLKPDFTVDTAVFANCGKTVFLANP